MKSELRFCDDIGMFSFDRNQIESCVHRTEFCRRTCFNLKLYNIYSDMAKRDLRLEVFWTSYTGKDLKKELSRKKTRQVKRVRYMTRGEALAFESDIDIIEDHVKENSDVDFWLPTRAWRNKDLWKQIYKRLSKYENLYVCLSLDPSNTAEEWDFALATGLSIMFYGDNSPMKCKHIKCPKTWNKKKGACAKCKAGCFSHKQRVIHLKMH